MIQPAQAFGISGFTSPDESASAAPNRRFHDCFEDVFAIEFGVSATGYWADRRDFGGRVFGASGGAGPHFCSNGFLRKQGPSATGRSMLRMSQREG
jgi:hypothetical protein